MNYSPEQFFELIEAIEAEGGVLTEDICSARRYDMTGKEGKPFSLRGCNNTSVFLLPYDLGDTLGEVRLCAVCDDLGATPRFEHVMGA